MLTQELIHTLRQQIAHLYEQTQAIDERNRRIKSDRFTYREYFNHQLFNCDSISLMDYVKEAEDNFNHLLRLKDADKSFLSDLGNKLTDQLSALTQIIRSNEVAVKEHFYQQQRRKQFYQKKKQAKENRYQQAAQYFMRNSHELHQELAQNFEFERRLNEMVYERQAKMKTANKADGQKLQQEILALHQRLGRCRRAITAVEERIATAESK